MKHCSRGVRAGVTILYSTMLLYALPASAVNWILLQETESPPRRRPIALSDSSASKY